MLMGKGFAIVLVLGDFEPFVTAFERVRIGFKDFDFEEL